MELKILDDRESLLRKSSWNLGGKGGIQETSSCLLGFCGELVLSSSVLSDCLRYLESLVSPAAVPAVTI